MRRKATYQPRVTLSLQCKSQILESRTAVIIAITIQGTASECGQTQTKTKGEWDNHADSICSELFCDSDADASVVIVPHRESSPMAQPVTKLLQKH